VRVRVASPGARPLGSAYVALAALMWSLAGILQRQLHMSLASQLAGRAAFAFLAVLVFVAVAERGQVIRAFRAIGRPGLAVAALIAIASGSFITALNDTSVANVLCGPAAGSACGSTAGHAHRRAGASPELGGDRRRGRGLRADGRGADPPGLSGLVFSFTTMLAFAAMLVICGRRKADRRRGRPGPLAVLHR
jgi:hypothetical protein